MPTTKLYYDNQYAQNFTAHVIKSGKDNHGRYYVVLDKTAFYPTGGGQPHDEGSVNNIQVTDVEEINGEIFHYVDEHIEKNINITGKIDWKRRFDHMQQHAGQHVLSAVFDNNYGLQTVSFHLGKEICTIDIETSELTSEIAREVEEVANDIILQNKPIKTKWVTEEDLAHYPLRKKVSVTNDIRLVIIPGVDYNGCGGTHPNSTSEIGSIKTLHWEKHRNNIRLHFICGDRVRHQFDEKQRIIQQLIEDLSVPQEKINNKLNQLVQRNKELEKSLEGIRSRYIELEAKALIHQARDYNQLKIIQAYFQQRPINELQMLARKVTEQKEGIIGFFITENKDKLQLVLSRSEDVNVDMNQLLKDTLPLIDGRGGGKASFAQGGGERLRGPEEVMEHLFRKLKQTVTECK